MAIEVPVLYTDRVIVPEVKTAGAAGFDIYVSQGGVIKADRVVGRKFVVPEDRVSVTFMHDVSSVTFSKEVSVLVDFLKGYGEEHEFYDVRDALDVFYDKYFAVKVNSHKTSRELFLNVPALDGYVIERNFGTFKTCSHRDPALNHYDIEKYPLIVETDLHVAIPEGYGMEIVDRSGYGFNQSLSLHNGTIDSDFRGEVKLKVYNLGNEDVYFNAGDRLAQGILFKTHTPVFPLVDKLDETDRGENWGGSTGR